jgi:hypothetical protein
MGRGGSCSGCGLRATRGGLRAALGGLRPALGGLIALLSGCAFYPVLPVPELEGEWAVRRIEAEEIAESSGLVGSRQHAGVFWTHNDSGDASRIFAITAEGRLLGGAGPVR